MTPDRNDPEGARGAEPARATETQESYKLHELAQMLDAPVDKVRGWLREGGVHPVHPDNPEDYGVDAIDYVRARMHQL